MSAAPVPRKPASGAAGVGVDPQARALSRSAAVVSLAIDLCLSEKVPAEPDL